jgi:single-strand DNA-binding protein
MMNVFGVGRLAHDPELRYTPNGKAVCEFSLAVNEYRKINGERKKFAHFFKFVVWDKAAELICQYCKQGDELQVRGTPREDRWEQDDGQKRSRIVFRLDEFEFGRRAAKNIAADEAPPEADVAVENEEEVPF